MIVRKFYATRYTTVITILLCMITVALHAQDWQLKKDEDGIKVYTGNDNNSDFKSIKVDFTVKATFSQLVALLLDIKKQHEWVYGSRSAEMVRVVADNEFIFHSDVSVPWPCADRDYIAHITVAQPSPQLITIDSRSEPDMLPVEDGIVRVKRSSAHWDVTAAGKDMVRIIYTVSFDPAGSVPAWLTNMFVVKGPLQTFRELKARVGSPEYRDVHYAFIKDYPG